MMQTPFVLKILVRLSAAVDACARATSSSVLLDSGYARWVAVSCCDSVECPQLIGTTRCRPVQQQEAHIGNAGMDCFS